MVAFSPGRSSWLGLSISAKIRTPFSPIAWSDGSTKVTTPRNFFCSIGCRPDRVPPAGAGSRSRCPGSPVGVLDRDVGPDPDRSRLPIRTTGSLARTLSPSCLNSSRIQPANGARMMCSSAARSAEASLALASFSVSLASICDGVGDGYSASAFWTSSWETKLAPFAIRRPVRLMTTDGQLDLGLGLLGSPPGSRPGSWPRRPTGRRPPCGGSR